MLVKIKADIAWSHPKFGKVPLSNGSICLSEDSIKVCGEVSREDSWKFTLAHPAYADICADLEKNVGYCNATLDGAAVDLDLSGHMLLAIPNLIVLRDRLLAFVGICQLYGIQHET